MKKIGSSCVIYRFDVLLQHRTVRSSSKTNGCDERKKSEDEKSRRLGYTGLNPRLIGELEHLKIKKRLIDETFASVMSESLGEYVLLK